MNPEQTSASVEIIDSANDLLMFVNNLIGQAQLDTGRIILKAKPFLMDELMDACQTAVSLPAQKKGLEMKYLVDAGLPKIIIGDPYWLRQIVLNLVFNAVKFTDRGSVSLRFFRPNPENWAIQVTDTGVGIPEQARLSIFEPFRQVDGSTTREFSGSGLGLSIVKELTTLMHGSICLDSQLGVGSTFTVNLPWITQEKI